MQIARAGTMLEARMFDSKSNVPSTGPPEDYFIKG